MGDQTISAKVRLAETFYNIEETKRKHNNRVEFDGVNAAAVTPSHLQRYAYTR